MRKHCKGEIGAFSLCSVAVNWPVQFVQDIQDSLTTQFQHPSSWLWAFPSSRVKGSGEGGGVAGAGQVAHFNFTECS